MGVGPFFRQQAASHSRLGLGHHWNTQFATLDHMVPMTDSPAVKML